MARAYILPDLPTLPLWIVGRLIVHYWRNPPPQVRGVLVAMASPDTPPEVQPLLIRRFIRLSNGRWTGAVAVEIRKELARRIADFYPCG